MKRPGIAALAAIALLSACNIKEMKDPGDLQQGQTPTLRTISFNMVQQQVLGPGKCATCHSTAQGNPGGVNCESYSSVKEYASRMMNAVANDRMPKAPVPPLPAAAKDVLHTWMNAGMPENEVSVNPTPSPSPSASASPAPAPEYADVANLIFSPKCVHCHSVAGGNKGKINLETYANVKANLYDALAEIESGDMPPRGNPIDAADQAFLSTWAAAGAPQGDDVPLPPPPPPPPPLGPSFTSLEANIFGPKCTDCHRAGHAEGGLALDDFKTILAAPLLIQPGHSEESWLMYMIERTDAKKMPPVESKETLSAQEIDTIRKWIDLGAPQ